MATAIVSLDHDAHINHTAWATGGFFSFSYNFLCKAQNSIFSAKKHIKIIKFFRNPTGTDRDGADEEKMKIILSKNLLLQKEVGYRLHISKHTYVDVDNKKLLNTRRKKTLLQNLINCETLNLVTVCILL